MTIRHLALIIALGTAVFAQEKKIQRADLPAAVEKTISAQSQGATIKELSQEEQNGQPLYEAEMVVNGHSRDISIDSTGAITEVEEQIAFDSLPAPVKAALRAKADPGKIAKVESITKHGKLVAYEAKVLTAGKKSEIQVGPGGTSLNHEE